MNPKLIIISRLLTLSLLFFFISCTDELYNTKELHTSVDKNKISLAQFKKETTIAALKPIVSAPKTTSITSKGKLQLNDFIIDTLAIKKFIAKPIKPLIHSGFIHFRLLLNPTRYIILCIGK